MNFIAFSATKLHLVQQVQRGFIKFSFTILFLDLSKMFLPFQICDSDEFDFGKLSSDGFCTDNKSRVSASVRQCENALDHRIIAYIGYLCTTTDTEHFYVSSDHRSCIVLAVRAFLSKLLYMWGILMNNKPLVLTKEF